jgi:hypothetical protein
MKGDSFNVDLGKPPEKKSSKRDVSIFVEPPSK